MSNAKMSPAASSLRRRLLQDIAEMQEKPYPNIELHFQDHDITKACLILTTDRYGRMHMTVELPENYPLQPPRIKMDDIIDHPNVFGDYVCASILNTTEGYTPAYTLKSIAIQMLSFFSSDSIEQVGGDYSVNLNDYGGRHNTRGRNIFKCSACRYGLSFTKTKTVDSINSTKVVTPQSSSEAGPSGSHVARTSKTLEDMKLPAEVIIIICDNLDTEELMAFAQAWNRVGEIMTDFDLIRTRELQCFCLKKDFATVNLGIGVNVSQTGITGAFSSEFDLLSHEGYSIHRVRRSVQGVPFEYWLPLPISQGHWRRVMGMADQRLKGLADAARLGNVRPVEVLFRFMNEVVVKLNQSVSEATIRSNVYPYEETAKSTLTHASEKAIESYFHLFHLLLCLAGQDPKIVQDANALLARFTAGASSKTECPNLGHLLVAALISDVEMTDAMLKSIVKEAITRNVVWMLDRKGKGYSELAYLEPSKVSEYRLKKTFEASTTSYRLLMFLNLFRKTAVGTPRKPLSILCDEAFQRHGAPPRGSAKGLANAIKKIHQVSCFPEFLVAMGLRKPDAAWFTNFLRECVQASEQKGYSKMPIDQNRALWLRLQKEPNVAVKVGLDPIPCPPSTMHSMTFFPGRGGGNRGGRGGRGGGRGGRR